MNPFFEYRSSDVYLHHTASIGYEAHTPFSSNFHDMCELYYFISGNGSFTIEGTIYPLKKNTLLLLRPGETHSIQIENEPYERAVILFSKKFLHTLDPGEILTAPFYNRPLGKANLYEFSDEAGMLRSCFDAMTRPAATSEERLLFIRINLALVLDRIRAAFETRPCAETTGQDIVCRTMDFIHQNLREKWDLDHLAEELHHNKAYINRKFRAALGCGIWEYTIKKRILAARQHIYLTEDIHAAYENSGFLYYSTFWRNYKKILGISPAEDLTVYQKEKRHVKNK